MAELTFCPENRYTAVNYCRRLIGHKFDPLQFEQLQRIIDTYEIFSNELGILGMKENTLEGFADGHFHRACIEGDLDKAQWIAREFPCINIPDAVCVSLPSGETTFSATCAAGHLSVAMWLAECCTFGVRKGVACRDAALAIGLAAAAAKGQLLIVRWIVSTYVVEKSDIGDPLRLACIGGHAPVVYYLVVTFGINTQDISNRTALLRDACAGGAAVLAVIMCAVQFAESDLKGCKEPLGEHILSGACKLGDVKTVEILVQEFNLCVDDISRHDHRILRAAFESGSSELVLWLMRTFKLTDEEIAKVDEFGELLTLCHGNKELCRILNEAHLGKNGVRKRKRSNALQMPLGACGGN